MRVDSKHRNVGFLVLSGRCTVTSLTTAHSQKRTLTHSVLTADPIRIIGFAAKNDLAVLNLNLPGLASKTKEVGTSCDPPSLGPYGPLLHAFLRAELGHRMTVGIRYGVAQERCHRRRKIGHRNQSVQ